LRVRCTKRNLRFYEGSLCMGELVMKAVDGNNV